MTQFIRRQGKIKGLAFDKQCLVDQTCATFSAAVRPVVGATRDQCRVKAGAWDGRMIAYFYLPAFFHAMNEWMNYSMIFCKLMRYDPFSYTLMDLVIPPKTIICMNIMMMAGCIIVGMYICWWQLPNWSSIWFSFDQNAELKCAAWNNKKILTGYLTYKSKEKKKIKL